MFTLKNTFVNRVRELKILLPRPAKFRNKHAENNPIYRQMELLQEDNRPVESDDSGFSIEKSLYAILIYCYSNGFVLPTSIKAVAPDRFCKIPVGVFDILKTSRQFETEPSNYDNIDLTSKEFDEAMPTLRNTFLEFIEEEEKRKQKGDDLQKG